MRYAILDHYRVATGLPWLPGGVAVVSGSELPAVRYVPDELAQPAQARFRVEVELIHNAIVAGMDPAEAITRATRSGFSGYLSWQVAVRLDGDISLNALFEHYVTSGSQTLPSGTSELEPLLLPFG